MAEKSFRKAIAVIVVLLVLVPYAFLLYDSTVASGEENVELYFMSTDGTMKPIEKEVRGETREDTLLTTLHTLKEGPKTEGMLASVPSDIEFKSIA